MVVLFLIFLRNFYTVFHSDYTNLCSHQQSIKVPFSPHSHQIYLVFLKIAILTGMKWYLTVVLISSPLMVSGVEHLFIYLLAICMSLEKCLFSSSWQNYFYMAGNSSFNYLEQKNGADWNCLCWCTGSRRKVFWAWPVTYVCLSFKA